jgi:hypothetical protein
VRRWRYLLSALVVGAAIALGIYGFIVRGLGLNHGLKSAYCVVAVILVLVSRRLARGESDDRPGLLAMLGAAVVGGAAAGATAFAVDPPPSCRSLVPRSLPGFTVDVPQGREELSGRDYSTGSLTVGLDDDNGVIVSWIPDAGSDALVRMSEGAKTGAGKHVRATHVARIAGRDTVVFDLDTGATMYLTAAPCDGRTVLVQSVGTSERMHDRVVRSFVCKPEPHPAETLPVVLDPAGLSLAEEKAGHVVYTNGGTALLAAAIVPLKVEHHMLSTAASSMLAGQGFEDVEVEPGGGDRVAFKATIHGSKGAGQVRAITCDVRSILVVSFVIENAPATLADALGTSVTEARCR